MKSWHNLGPGSAEAAAGLCLAAEGRIHGTHYLDNDSRERVYHHDSLVTYM